MKIVIDARFWGPSHTGLGVYTRELVTHLADIDQSNEYVLLIRQEAKDVIALSKNFTTVTSEATAYSLKEQMLLPSQLYTLKPDLVHFPSINVPILYFGKYIVTVHDLIKHSSRGKETSTHHPLLYWIKYLVYRITFLVVIRRAVVILVPSKCVEMELMKRYPFTKNKIQVTLESSVLEAGTKANISLPNTFAIYTGNAYPHKNIPRLIAAWKSVFEETGVVLLISSGRSFFSRKIEQLIDEQDARKYVRYCGYLSDDQLSTAYSRATLYVFPSLIEGFGIPGLDAMKYKLPVVCSNIPVLKEIYGDGAHYFDPTSIEDIAKKVIEVVTDKTLRSSLIKKGQEQVKKYSWEKTAEETLKVYNTAIK